MDNRLHRICFLAAFGLPLAVYFYTAAPGPFWQDSSVFSMAAATLSISHSPGFPLWVLIGKLFTWLIPENPARATNMMCGFFGAGASALFYLCTRKILTRLNDSLAPEENTEKTYSASTIALTALGAALVFAFSQTAWLQAVRAEVYSLQLVLTLSVLLLVLSLTELERPTRCFLLAAFLWGLSLTVHPLLSVSVLPGLLITGYFISTGWKKELAKWGWVILLVATALTVYLYLPIRSSLDPYFNWNQPDNMERFLAAVTRSGSWEASVRETPSNVSYPNVMRMFHFLTSEYTAVFWIFALVGTVRLARYMGRTGLGFFVLLLSNILVTLWAAEFDRRNMDILGYLSFGTGLAVLSAAAALFELFAWFSTRFDRPRGAVLRWAAPVGVGIFAFFLAGKNRARADLHQSIWPQKLTHEILSKLPPNAVVFFSSDRFLTPVLYLQGALDYRPDVAVLIIDVFRKPLLMEQALRRNRDLVFDSVRTGPRRKALQAGFEAFCRNNKRPIFTQLGNHIDDARHLWPAGHLLEYRREMVGAEAPKKVLEFIEQSTPQSSDFVTRESYAMEIHNWGSYLGKIGVPGNEIMLRKAVELDGENPRTWAGAGKAYHFLRQFELAETCFKLALTYDPYCGDNYLFLAYALQQQGKAEEARAALAEGAWLAPDKLKPLEPAEDKTGR